jgi:hypothetical protein
LAAAHIRIETKPVQNVPAVQSLRFVQIVECYWEFQSFQAFRRFCRTRFPHKTLRWLVLTEKLPALHFDRVFSPGNPPHRPSQQKQNPGFTKRSRLTPRRFGDIASVRKTVV